MQSGESLLPSQERIGTGSGRHGYNVTSPWYNGRGHHFTIIDSPAVTVGGQKLYASSLTPGEIFNVVQAYGTLNNQV